LPQNILPLKLVKGMGSKEGIRKTRYCQMVKTNGPVILMVGRGAIISNFDCDGLTILPLPENIDKFVADYSSPNGLTEIQLLESNCYNGYWSMNKKKDS
jgi:hypothetical protein